MTKKLEKAGFQSCESASTQQKNINKIIQTVVDAMDIKDGQRLYTQFFEASLMGQVSIIENFKSEYLDFEQIDSYYILRAFKEFNILSRFKCEDEENDLLTACSTSSQKISQEEIIIEANEDGKRSLYLETNEDGTKEPVPAQLPTVKPALRRAIVREKSPIMVCEDGQST